METVLKTRMRLAAPQPHRHVKALTPITLYYDAKDATALKTLDLFLSLGVFLQKRSALDEGIADIRAGRLTKINNPKNLIAECLK
ncbi:MAG: hypothetical protein LBN27_11800 [Prevotellaceae bacterium]|nr:hypothetical protein [Prevotellaceae bacterium]